MEASVDRTGVGVGGIPLLRDRDAGPGRARPAPPGPRSISAGRRRLERRLDHHRPGLRRRGMGLGGWRYRPGLPGGVPDRKEPVGRQHRLVRRNLLRVRHPGALPAPGAHDRHHRRTRDASRVHRRRHHAAGGHSPGHLRFRRRPARRRGQNAAQRHPGRAGAPARAGYSGGGSRSPTSCTASGSSSATAVTCWPRRCCLLW